MQFERTRKRPIDISLIPLINVIFLLLVFFLVAGTLVEPDEFTVEIPEGESSVVSDKSQITIVLTRAGEMKIGGVEVTPYELDNILKAQLEGTPDKAVVIKADAALSAAQLTSLIRAVSAAGGQNLAIATRAR